MHSSIGCNMTCSHYFLTLRPLSQLEMPWQINQGLRGNPIPLELELEESSSIENFLCSNNRS